MTLKNARGVSSDFRMKTNVRCYHYVSPNGMFVWTYPSKYSVNEEISDGKKWK